VNMVVTPYRCATATDWAPAWPEDEFTGLR
jgi:hypothetical protein